jgi:hypothetical protein
MRYTVTARYPGATVETTYSSAAALTAYLATLTVPYTVTTTD